MDTSSEDAWRLVVKSTRFAEHYAYLGRATTITDSKGKWKKLTTDELGNLVRVDEPGSLVTTYTYTVLDKLATVNMTRGATTQTRTFTYDGPYLISATNPETGTETYTYNAAGQISSRLAANGKRLNYYYDGYGRLNEVRRPNGLGEDVEVTYTYDANPYGWSFSDLYLRGRLGAVTFEGGRYEYAYDYAGRRTGKRFTSTEGAAGQFEERREYDIEGKLLNMTHPDGTVYTYGHDEAGRMNAMNQGITTVASVSLFSASGQWKSWTHDGIVETRQYNNLAQMTRLTAVGSGQTLVDMEYRFTPNNVPNGQNNGRIESAKDWVSGEDVAYQYDDLQRLVSAAASGGVSWSRTFSYDGFGNLTGGVTNGVAWTQDVNPATNRLTGWIYDASGNPTYAAGMTRTYDSNHRLKTDSSVAGLTYSYDHEGKRFRKQTGSYPNVVWEYYFYGVEGKLLYTSNGTSNLYFAGRLIRTKSGPVVTDRLGSVRWQQGVGALRYFPYGEEQTSTPQSQTVEKFGTYQRDMNGLDYADQRYHAPGTGRFLTADPYLGSARRGSPLTWNRYGYVGGDPINRVDPLGLFIYVPDVEPEPDPEPEVSDPIGAYCSAFPSAPICGGDGQIGTAPPGPDTTGGGGGPSVSAKKYSTTSKRAIAVQNVLRWLGAAIQMDETCNKWLKDNSTAIAWSLGEMQGSTMGVGVAALSGNTNAVVSTTGVTGVPSTAMITVNVNGAFFQSGVSAGYGVNMPGGSDAAKALILLHELAHLTGAENFRSGDQSEEDQRWNNALVLENCGGVVRRAAGGDD